ncbi:MAG: hypothetical protein OHK0052_24650 [Anaerolineales bacterium]
MAYVHPIESLSRLYAQRVRWQRGQLEVSARYRELMHRPVWKLHGFNPARVLMIDHTLSFPRLLWTFFLPVLMLFDYPLQLIFTSLLFMYIFYTALDLLWALTAYLGANSATRQRARQLAWVLPILPLYRMIVFWFRFSGFLHASAEPGQLWRVQDPWTQIRTGWNDLRQRFVDYFGR